jgi:pyrimidine deaminase RibD-like protein
MRHQKDKLRYSMAECVIALQLSNMQGNTHAETKALIELTKLLNSYINLTLTHVTYRPTKQTAVCHTK